ncbi:hypothetical protein ACFL54_05410 [Planctomycetota bacterium]
MNTRDSIENKLGQLTPQPPPDDAADRIRQQAEKIMNSPQWLERNRREQYPRIRHSILPGNTWLYLAAAVLLVCGGLFWLKGHLAQDSGGSGPDTEVVRISAEDRFYVLRIEPKKQSLIAQEFGDFTIKCCKLGSEIGGFVLDGVEDNGFSLRQPNGKLIHNEIDRWNQDSLSLLTQEVIFLKERHRAGQITSKDLDRLGSIARYGDLTALRVLKRIAADPGDRYHQQADRMLEGANPEALVMLIKQAKDYSNRYRKDLFLQLAKRKTILGSKALREVAIDTADPCQIHAIQALSDCGDKESLPTLEKIFNNPEYPKRIQEAALAAFEKLTQEVRK